MERSLLAGRSQRLTDGMDDRPNGIPFSPRARLASFGHAWRGLRRMVQREHNARIHLAASLGVIGAGLFLHVGIADWRWLVVAITMVWLAEAFNTAVENMCDHVEPAFDPAIGRVKDMAAGAVLIASLAAAAIGLLTLGPPILALLGAALPALRLTLPPFSG